MAEFPDPPDVSQIVDSTEGDRFGRLIAVAIVLVTLAAATTAWLQAGAGRDDDEAAVEAERLASQALGTLARAQALAELRVQRERLAEERGRRAESEARQLAFGVGGEREAAALQRGWRRAERATRRTTEKIAAAEGIPPLRGFREDRDPTFPFAYLTAASREAERLSSIRDAANDEGDRAEEQVGAYGVALTMFAVSVFLFGYALTPYGRRNRRLFASVGGVMAALAVTWTFANVLDPPDRAPDEAAAAFADATVAEALYEPEEAIAALDRSIELRPDNPAALIERGAVRLGSADLPREIPSPATAAELEAARDDFRRARALDEEDIDARIGLASTELELGVESGDRNAIERAASAADETIERDPAGVPAHLVRAVAALALGEPDALLMLGEASARIAATDDGEGPRDPDGRHELVIGLMLSLERVAEAGLIDEETLTAAKGEVVRGAWRDATPPLRSSVASNEDGDDEGDDGSPAGFKGLRLEMNPAGYEVGWAASSRSGPPPPRTAPRPSTRRPSPW